MLMLTLFVFIRALWIPGIVESHNNYEIYLEEYRNKKVIAVQYVNGYNKVNIKGYSSARDTWPDLLSMVDFLEKLMWELFAWVFHQEWTTDAKILNTFTMTHTGNEVIQSDWNWSKMEMAGLMSRIF